MKRRTAFNNALFGLFVLSSTVSCSTQEEPNHLLNELGSASEYLYVWAGADLEDGSDFLAVIDVDPGSSRYGEVLASVEVGVRGAAHHSEHVMPKGDSLFVNSFEAGKSFIIDLSDPLNPTVAVSLVSMGNYTYPHTFERLPNGNVLTTYQTKGEGNQRAGGLVELDPSGNFVQSVDVENPLDPDIRAYSVTAIPRLGIAVSTTSDMWSEKVASSFQVWRISDLTPMNTVLLPKGEHGYEHQDPSEIRVLSDSVTAMMGTFTCSLYLILGQRRGFPLPLVLDEELKGVARDRGAGEKSVFQPSRHGHVCPKPGRLAIHFRVSASGHARNFIRSNRLSRTRRPASRPAGSAQKNAILRVDGRDCSATLLGPAHPNSCWVERAL